MIVVMVSRATRSIRGLSVRVTTRGYEHSSQECEDSLRSNPLGVKYELETWLAGTP